MKGDCPVGTSETYRRKITVDHTKVSNEDLSDFPLLIVFEDSALKSVAHGGHVAGEEGEDIHFVGADGNRLDYEVERYDAAAGSLRAWVKIPRLSNNADTEICLCYGRRDNAGEGSGSVWDLHYKLVRHSNTTPGGHEIVPHTEDLNVTDAVTVEAWFCSEESRSDAFQALVSKWSLRAAMDAFESYDAGEADGLNTRGFFGAVCDGRYVYFSPQYNGEECHGQALRYDTHGEFTDPASWSGYDAGNTSGLKTKGYYGAVHAGDYVYYVPRTDGEGYHSRVLRYDTRGDFRNPKSWSAFDAGNIVSYQSGVYDGRYIYFVPGSEEGGGSGKVLRYDTQGDFTDAASYITYDAGNTSGLDSGSYDGACFDGRYVYFSPLNQAGIALRLDTRGVFDSPESWAAFDAGDSGLAMCVGAIFDGRYVYYVPYGRSTAVRYDTCEDFQDAAGWEVYDAANTSGLDTTGYDGACFDGRYVYFIPFWDGVDPKEGFHARLLRYDTLIDFSDSSAWAAADGGAFTDPPNPGGFNGGAFDGRYLYFAPWRENAEEGPHGRLEGWWSIAPHGQVLRYDTTDSDASFILKYVECGHNGGLCASLPGPTFSVNTGRGILNVRANRPLEPGWHHVAGVYDGARLSLYVDGELINEAVGEGAIQAGEADIGIGCIAGGGAQFKGNVHEVRISDVARSRAWIETTSRNLEAPQTFVKRIEA